MESKICNNCKNTLPVSFFSKDRNKKDGLRTICKPCTGEKTKARYAANSDALKAYAIKWRKENKEKVEQYKRENAELLREKQRQKRAKNPEKVYEEGRRYYETNAKRVIARARLHRAIASGKVVPMLCQVCGEYAHGHHPDYDRPLDVVWLCPKHHAQAHALVREIENELG